MHQLVPFFIQENYAAGKYNGSFPAVGLFLDISGFSAMTDALMTHGQHGAEVLAGILRVVMDPLIESVFEQEGFIASSAGDALTALFPVRSTELDACLHALAAALKIQERLSAREDFTTSYQTFRISAKIGLSFGEARWGIITTEEGQRGVYYFQGTVIDGCAEAEHQAQAGDVMICNHIRALLQPQLVTEPAGNYYRVLQVQAELPACSPIHVPRANPGIMAHFFPQNLINQPFNGEFRQVVSMFISLPSVRTEGQLKIFVESLFALQEKYGGMLSRLDFGDKGTNLLLFWGAPVAYENDIERAVNFTLDLQTATSIPISAGITYRMSHAGFIGGRLYEEYTCSGRGVNLAARFMTAAPRGEIWVDEMVAARMSNRYEIEFVSETSFKGFRQPQKVYALLERKEKPIEFFAGALAGREEELILLREYVRPLLEGRFAGMFVVSGEPGIGKSRLIYEIQREMLEQHPGEVQFFLGQMDEIQRQSFTPFQYWLRHYFSVSDSQGEARNKRNFNRKLDELISLTDAERLADELDRTRSFLGALIGLEWPDSLYEQLDAKGRYQNTMIALASLLQAESLRAPVIFILEDIDWLDDASKAFLPYLLRIAVSQGETAFPFALLSTSRFRGCNLGIEGLQCSELRLEGLDRQSLKSLTMTLFDAPPAESLLDLLLKRAEGNPFYAEQFLHFMREEGWLVRGKETWEINPGLMDALPTDVNVLLVARLDHLAQEVKEIVQTASVLGREFELNLLSTMLQKDDPALLKSGVASAEQEAIWTALNEIRYIFKHILMRDAAYQMLLHTRRKKLHALAVQAYEDLYAANLDDHSSEIGYHAEQAGQTDKARHYLTLAGTAAQNVYQNSLAVDYFTRALALTAEDDLEARYDLLMAREYAYKYLGNTAARQLDQAALHALLPVLGSERKKVEILLRQAEFEMDIGASIDAAQTASGVKEIALSAGLPLKAAEACWLVANCFLKNGKLEQGASYAKEGLGFVRQVAGISEEKAGASGIEMRLQNALGLISIDQEQFDAAHNWFTQSLEIARQTESLRYQAAPLNNLGRVAESQGREAAAREYFEQALELARKAGERQSEGIALGNLGFSAKKSGEFDQARVYLEQSLRIIREVGAPYYEVYSLINLSACLSALGDHPKAVELARQSHELANQIADPSGAAWALTYLGHGLLALGDYEAAHDAYKEAVAIRESQQQPVLACEPAAGAARAALERGDLAHAQKHLEPVLTYLGSGGSLDSTDEPLRVYHTCYLVLEQAGDPRSKEMLQTAYQHLQKQASHISDPSARQAFLENIEHHRQILSAWESKPDTNKKAAPTRTTQSHSE